MIWGNARHLPLAEGSVQCVVTSPPYWGLRDYGVAWQLGLESTPDEYVANMVGVFREVWRVLREDGTLWLNLGDSYFTNWGSVRAEGGGGFKDVGRYRRKDGANMAKQLVGIPWRVAFALQADGWYLRQDIIWAKPNPMPESVRDRCTKAHEYVFLLTKKQKYYYDADAIREPHARIWDASKPNGSINCRKDDASGIQPNPLGANRRSVWTVNTQPYPEAHFATFPEKLVEPCVLAGTKAGDLVLDPFAGSGTVGVVCRRFARRFVGLELNEAYVGMAQRRLRETQPGMALEAVG